jgi:hypothetical protein
MQHSTVVGGSTAARVINCPASVAMAEQMPARASSSYADEGTLLHNAIAAVLDTPQSPASLLGMAYEGLTLTQELVDDKLLPALAALDEIDPDRSAEMIVETRVDFGNFIPQAWGSCDLIMRRGPKVIVLDWKFGREPVSAVENAQLMFYACAAMRTAALDWAFQGATEIELIIVQPPGMSRWTVTHLELEIYERTLRAAVLASQAPEPRLAAGAWCRWCPAKPTCPAHTGAVERALALKLTALDPAMVGQYLRNAELLEGWIRDLRALAMTKLEAGQPVDGYKLVAKRATRAWRDETDAAAALRAAGVEESELMVSELKSPAQVEKVLKKTKTTMPDGLIVAISSGHTLASEDDSRAPVVLIGQQLLAALNKL